MTQRGRLVVIGAGGHGKVLVSAAQASGWWVLAVLDDDESLWGQHLLGVEIAGGVHMLQHLEFDGAVIGVGNNHTRRAVAAHVEAEWATVIHPSAVVHPDAVLGKGTVVYAGAVIQPGSVLGEHVIVNTCASVDHDCRVGDFVHVAPGCNLAGHVTVGEGAFVGIGSTAIPFARIGAWTTVAAGAAVTKEVPDGATAAGVPAHIIYNS